MPSVSIQLLWNVLKALSLLGADVETIRRRCPALQGHAAADGRVPVKVLHDFWAVVVAVTRDPGIGARVGSRVRIETYGAVGDVLRSSATLGDAFVKCGRYVRFWNESVIFSALIDMDRALLWQRSTAREHRHPASADAVLALILAVARQLTDSHLVPDEVHFAHPAPRDDSPYREAFGGGVLRFGQPEYALAFPPEIFTLPIRTHDFAQRDSSVERANQLVGEISGSTRYALRAAELIETELRGGNPTVKNVAAKLGLHPKALMRHLKSEGTSHRELLDSRRRDLAQRYVAASDLNMNEVAFLLGFSDSSAFTKSFKRWTGLPPYTFRKRARSEQN